MTDVLRKIVKPAHEGASIPDPAHRNCIAQDGTEVVWDHYWIGRLRRGEIVIVEPEVPADAVIDDTASEALAPSRDAAAA